MKTVMVNPPWITEKKIGFRSNVRWPFMISKREFDLQKQALYHFPLYQAYTAALLQRHGHEVAVLDAAVDCLGPEEFRDRLEQSGPDLIVMEISTPSAAIDLETVRAIKRRLKVPILLVGSHATVFHREILENYSDVDMIARGEFETTILEVAESLAAGKELTGVEGFSLRTLGGEFRENPTREFISDLDALPYPARELYPWQRYHEPVFDALPWVTMISSRGCPYQCIFCNWPQTMYGHRYRVRRSDRIVDEMEHCLLSLKPGEIFFDDDTFTVDKKRVQEICRMIIERKLEVIWSCMGRLDTVDLPTLELMARAGCRRIKFGIETGDRQIMKTIKKRIDLDVVKTTISQAKEVGIKVHGTFMIGLPGETMATVNRTIDLACSLALDSAQFSIATPFPGTEFFNMAQREGWLLTTEWSRYDGASGSVVSYPQLSKKQIDSMLSVAWTSLYANKNDLLALSRRAMNKLKDAGARETFGIIRDFFLTRISRTKQ